MHIELAGSRSNGVVGSDAHIMCSMGEIFCVQKVPWDMSLLNNSKVLLTLNWIDKMLVLGLCKQELYCSIAKIHLFDVQTFEA